MKTNTELAHECGAKTLIRCKDGNLEITMTQAQLDAFAERIRADGLTCYGHSETLRLKSRSCDTALLKSGGTSNAYPLR